MKSISLILFFIVLVSSVYASGSKSFRVGARAKSVQQRTTLQTKLNNINSPVGSKEVNSVIKSLNASEKKEVLESDLLKSALKSDEYGKDAKAVVDKLNEDTKKKILSKDIGSKIKLKPKKAVGSNEIDLPVAVLGVDESIEDYLLEKKKSDRKELIRRKRLKKKDYSLDDQAAFEFRRRYKKLYWKRYRNRRWSQFVKDHWSNFKSRYIAAIRSK